jgi:hypothetical protein
MSKREGLILVIGYGNPGRHDDGLGPAFAELVEKLDLDHVTVEAGYQLTVEDAAIISEHDVVVFVDAAMLVAGLSSFAGSGQTLRWTSAVTSSSRPPSLPRLEESTAKRQKAMS